MSKILVQVYRMYTVYSNFCLFVTAIYTKLERGIKKIAFITDQPQLHPKFFIYHIQEQLKKIPSLLTDVTRTHFCGNWNF